jgi:two-component system response regulator HydG
MKVDVRVVSASNKDLPAEVRAGRFREDLLYRLNVVSIKLPSLKERKEDIPLLVDHFLKRKSKSRPKTVSAEAMAILERFDWPGNVRELEHVIEGATVLSREDTIEARDLWINPSLSSPAVQPNLNSARTDHTGILSLEETERRHIEVVLKHNQWNRIKTAQMLGITPKTLYLKIKKYDIKHEN